MDRNQIEEKYKWDLTKIYKNIDEFNEDFQKASKEIEEFTKYENIMGAAKFLREEYLTPGGLYFNGYTTWGLNQSYCLDANGNPDDAWRIGVNSIAKNYEWAYKNIVLK